MSTEAERGHSNVVTLHGRCRSCHRPHSRAVRSVLQRLCGACFDGAADYIAREREVFAGLLALGIDEATANVMMIAKHESEGYSA